jgi:hypothetical protein
MRTLVLVGLGASLPLLAGYSAFASCARCLKNPARSARFVSSANPSKEELLARLAEMEQAKFAAERAAAPPPVTRKSPLEKLRIVFGGKRSIPTTASAKLLVIPEDPPREHPTVALPPGFAPPLARPFVPTGDYMTLLSAVAALLIRCLAGLFVVGWRPRLSFRPPPKGEYRLRLGPLYLSDTSDVLRGAVACRPRGRLILYEFDSSPFCRKVRDACTHLDLVVEMRPCPGAGIAPPNFFGNEHLALHGRRTVPFLLDEGAGVGLYESEEIVTHLYERYGPVPARRPPFTLRGTFALISCGMAAIVRGMPADKLQVDARPDNHLMRPLTLYGHEGSPFVHPVRVNRCCESLCPSVLLMVHDCS